MVSKKDPIKIYTGETITDAEYDSIKNIEFIKVSDLKWTVSQFKKSIAGHTEGGRDVLKGIEVIFHLRKNENHSQKG
jgi:hypothetical protein